MFPNYIAYNFLFAEVFGRFVYVQDLPYILFPIAIPLVIYQIAGHFFKGRLRWLPTLISIISPWFWYLYETQSLYVLVLFLVLTASEGIILIREGRGALGNIYFFLSSLILGYFSSLFLLFIPIFTLILLAAKVIELANIKYSLIALAMFLIPLLLFIGQNKSVLKYRYDNEIALFRDPGLLNTVNRYQGAARQEGLGIFSKLSQNKYLFFSEYFTLKYVSQLIPVTYFTPEYKLLGFSVSPPIFIGFIIPFVYGLFRILKLRGAEKLLIISTLLAVPSVLGGGMVSINRLILLMPVVLIIISFGFKYLWAGRLKVFLGLTIFLVFFQMVITILDVKDREPIRSKAYFGKRYIQIEP